MRKYASYGTLPIIDKSKYGNIRRNRLLSFVRTVHVPEIDMSAARYRSSAALDFVPPRTWLECNTLHPGLVTQSQ